MPETRALRGGRERAELHDRLEDNRLLGRRVDLEVVVDPEGLEAESLRLLSDLDRSPPGRGCIHAEKLAVAALGHRDPDLHGDRFFPFVCLASFASGSGEARSSTSHAWSRAGQTVRRIA